MRTLALDVHYVPSTWSGFGPSIANVIQSWDDSLYIETNVRELAGRVRWVCWGQDGFMTISGELINGGLTPMEKFILNRTWQKHQPK